MLFRCFFFEALLIHSIRWCMKVVEIKKYLLASNIKGKIHSNHMNNEIGFSQKITSNFLSKKLKFNEAQNHLYDLFLLMLLFNFVS